MGKKDYKVREKQGIVLKYMSIHVSLCSERGLRLDCNPLKHE